MLRSFDGAMFVLERVDIMQRIEHRTLTIKEPWMLGYSFAIDNDADPTGEKFNRRWATHTS